MVVFSLDLETCIVILVIAFIIVARIVLLKSSFKKISPSAKDSIRSSSSVRTGRFKLFPYGDKYVLYAEYSVWIGDVYHSKRVMKYLPANSDDVDFYYQKTTHELP